MGERENRIKGTVGKLTSAKGLECLFIVTRKQCCPHELGYRYLDRYDWSSWNFFLISFIFSKKRKKNYQLIRRRGQYVVSMRRREKIKKNVIINQESEL